MNDWKTLILIFAALLPLLQSGCASAPKDAGEETQKVGMHIDAMFEFAVEYPLSWPKTRQQNHETGWGQVRWSKPGSPDVQMAVSTERLTAENASPRRRLDQLLDTIPAFEVVQEDTVELPGGQALHVTGRMDEFTVDLHLFNSDNRVYLLRFSAPEPVFDDYSDLLFEFAHSFVTLAPADATTGSHP